MKKNRLKTRTKLSSLLLMGLGALCFCACADTYDGNDSWTSSVKGTKLASPDDATITVTPSTDGSQQTIAWKVVPGAGQYELKLFNLTAETELSDTIDGCSFTTTREEDTNYRLELRTLGNADLRNTDADAPTVKAFSTFEAAFAAIDETDLVAYFEHHPIPEDAEQANLIFDLAEGTEYTVSGTLDFYNHQVTLRTTSKTNPATIVLAQGGGLATCAGLTLKNLVFECGATTSAVVSFSANPDPAILDADHNNHHQIREPFNFQNCVFNNVTRYLVYDNKVKYCLKDFVMNNCLVKFTPDDKMSSGAYFQIYDGGGFICDFTATNSTFWSATDNKVNYFIRYNNAGRCDRAGYTTNSINLVNCTFYNIAKEGQMSNHSGFDGRATSNYDIRNNIFVDCGSGQVPRRLTGRINTSAVNNFAYNTYWFDGAPETEGFSTETYDASHNALQTDPAFVNAAEGNFTPQGAEQLERQAGDPRWLQAQ